MTIMHRPNHKLDLLASLRVFSHCPPEELAILARLTTQVTRPAGRVLCTEGQRGREVFVIVEGEVAVEIGGRHIATLGRGALVGELALLDRGPRTGTVVALTDVELLVMSGLEFASVLDNSPHARQGVLETVSGRLRTADTRLR